MEILIIWIGLSILAGVIANNRGRSGDGFFLLSLLLSPIIGIIAALVVKENVQVTTARLEEEKLASGSSKKCPFCAEIVKNEAKICRFCGKEFPKFLDPRLTAETYAIQSGEDIASVIESLRNGELEGRLEDSQWYVSNNPQKDQVDKRNALGRIIGITLLVALILAALLL